MDPQRWTLHFKPFRTRTEVRSTLATTLTGMVETCSATVTFPEEIAALSTGNDREVMESFLRVKAFCDGRKGSDRRSVAADIGRDVRELFSQALDRMKELPPEPIKRDPIVSVAQVRRA
jgi:hypothetical protein